MLCGMHQKDLKMIIESLLDSDYYKFGMGQIALHQFPTVEVEYEFKCRNEANWTWLHEVLFNKEIDAFCKLKFKEEE